MGIDYGTKRIGLALGDTESGVASPWRVIENAGTDECVLRLKELAGEEGIEEAVVGVPETPGGDAISEIATLAVEFISQLKAAGFVVHRENEMLSSKIAATQMQEMDRKDKRDDLAAAAILQSYLDRLCSKEGSPS